MTSYFGPDGGVSIVIGSLSLQRLATPATSLQHVTANAPAASAKTRHTGNHHLVTEITD